MHGPVAVRPPGWVPPRRWWQCVACDVRWQAHGEEPCWSCGVVGVGAFQPGMFGAAHFIAARADV